jgi:hypothetical protein
MQVFCTDALEAVDVVDGRVLFWRSETYVVDAVDVFGRPIIWLRIRRLGVRVLRARKNPQVRPGGRQLAPGDVPPTDGFNELVTTQFLCGSGSCLTRSLR